MKSLTGHSSIRCQPYDTHANQAHLVFCRPKWQSQEKPKELDLKPTHRWRLIINTRINININQLKNSKMRKTKTKIKVIVMMTVSLLIGLQMNAQFNHADSLQMQFDSLDSKYFPSGILHNTSPYYQDCFVWDSIVQRFNLNSYYLPSPYLYEDGLIEMSYKTFTEIYFDLYLSSVRDWAITNPNDYFTSDSIARLSSNFPISILRMNFHELDRSAVGTGKLWYDTLINQYTIMPDTIRPPDSLNYPDSIYYVVDNPDSLAYLAFNNYWVNGANTTNPYIYVDWTNKDNSNSQQWDYSYSATYSIPQGLFLTNDSNNITSVRIDYDDGKGFVTQNIGAIKNIVYHEIIPIDVVDGQPVNEIPKLYDKTITLRLPPNNKNDDSLTLKFGVKIIINENPADTTFTTDQLPFLCTISDSGHSASQAKVSIRYANSSYRHLTKPIIISGGFEADLRDYGALRYDGLMTGYFYDAKGKRILQRLKEMPLLLDSLNDIGYDIIFIDQKYPRDTIQNNGLALIKLIQWTNQQLELNGSNEKLIVLGASMGGLIVRYALRMMEMQGCCHNTRIYATFDSPHNGANISISSQYFVKDLRDFALASMSKKKRDDINKRNKSIFAPIIAAYDDVLNSPAARQMLIYHREQSAYTDYSEFYSFMDSIGQPQNCRKLAIVNGSEQALPNTISNSDKLLLSIDKTVPSPFIHSPLPGPWWNAVTIPYSRTLIHLNAFSEGETVMYQHNDFNKANIYWGKALLTKIPYTASMFVTDIIGSLYPALYSPMQGVKFALKGVAAIHYSYLNNQYWQLLNVQNTLYPINYTEAPGSRSETFKEVADAANKYDVSNLTLGLIDSLKISLIKSGTPSHTFMPSGTALDMHESNLMLNIRNAYLADQSITPFDCYWAPGRMGNDYDIDTNMLHVEVNQFNRAWILEQIKNDWELRNGNGEYKGVLTGYYNYGRSSAGQYNDNIELLNKPYQTILYTIDIKNNGQLYVNKQDKIGLSTGTLYPRQGSTFKLKTNCEPCDSTVVRIKDGGQFIVGDLSNGILNKGEVRFCKNSRLEIFNNGQLIVKDSSRLIIEKGATLVIHNGAYILLDGPNAVLEIRGKIVIDDNTTLEPYGDGFIRFAAKMNSSNINDYWQVGSGSYLVLANYYGSAQKKAEVVENLFIPDSLNQYFVNAIIEIDSMKTINDYGSIKAQYSIFKAKDSTKFYNAFKVYGQPNTRFGSCEFKFGDYGLSAQMSYGGNTFTLDTCKFTYNYIGFYTSDEYIYLNKCEFNNNIDFGWKAENMQASCDAVYCRFKNNGFAGAYFSGQSNVILNISHSNFSYNNQYGLEISEASLHADCSVFSFNSLSGIYAQENANIYLSDKARNQIISNQTGILLDKAYSLKIENGLNNFSGNQYFIVGEVKPDNYYQGLSTASPIDLYNNVLPSASANQMPINVYLYEPQYNNLISVPLINWSQNLSSFQTHCINSAIVANINNYKMFRGKITTAIITTNYFQNTYLIDALKSAAMQMSYGEKYTGNDTLAISMFKGIFDNIPANLNEDERWAIDQGLSLMMTSLTYAIDHKLIDPDRAMDGMPVDKYVGMIAEEIQNRLNDIDYANTYAQEQKAYYKLLLAQMYRAAEHYDYALAILQNDNFFFNTTLKNQADYWNCVCDAENQLLKGNIDRSQYQLQIDSCHELSTARKSMFMPIFGYNEVGESVNKNQIIGIYPNPAEQLIAVEFTQSVTKVIVELSDLSGKIIWQTTKIVDGKQLRLKLPKISSGAYMLKTITDNQVFNNKIIIR